MVSTSTQDICHFLVDSSNSFTFWDAKAGGQEIAGVTGKFGLGLQNEAGQRLTVLPREHTDHSKHSSNNTRDDSTHGHHQMVNTEIRFIIFFASEDGEALYS